MTSWYASRPATCAVPSTVTDVVSSTAFRASSASSLGVAGTSSAGPGSLPSRPCPCPCPPDGLGRVVDLVRRAVVRPHVVAVVDDAVLGGVVQERQLLLVGAVGGDPQRVRAGGQFERAWRTGRRPIRRRPRRGRREARLLARPPRSGRPRSVLIFTVPDSCCTSDAAIFSMSSCALIFGRSGSPESAKRRDEPDGRRRHARSPRPGRRTARPCVAAPARSSASAAVCVADGAVVGFVRCHVCLTSVVGGGVSHVTRSRHSHPNR